MPHSNHSSFNYDSSPNDPSLPALNQSSSFYTLNHPSDRPFPFPISLNCVLIIHYPLTNEKFMIVEVCYHFVIAPIPMLAFQVRI